MNAVITDTEAVANVAANATRLRDERGWSLRDLATKIEEPLTSVFNALAGENEPGVGIVAKLAEAFEVTVDDLLENPRKFRRKTG